MFNIPWPIKAEVGIPFEAEQWPCWTQLSPIISAEWGVQEGPKLCFPPPFKEHNPQNQKWYDVRITFEPIPSHPESDNLQNTYISILLQHYIYYKLDLQF